MSYLCTKTQIVADFKQYLADKWGYVWGAQGEMYNKWLAEKWKNDKSRGVPSSAWKQETYYTQDCAKWYGHYVADCSGSFVATFRKYDKNFTDRNANAFFTQATEKGKINTIPEIPGLAVWKDGHIGLYIGNGEVIEFKGTVDGCVKTKLKERPWKYWLKLKDVDYSNPKTYTTVKVQVLRLNDKGSAVKSLQALLAAENLLQGKIDGVFGKQTEQSVKDAQHFFGLTEDGIAGSKTWEKLLN